MVMVMQWARRLQNDRLYGNGGDLVDDGCLTFHERDLLGTSFERFRSQLERDARNYYLRRGEASGDAPGWAISEMVDYVAGKVLSGKMRIPVTLRHWRAMLRVVRIRYRQENQVIPGCDVTGLASVDNSLEHCCRVAVLQSDSDDNYINVLAEYCRTGLRLKSGDAPKSCPLEYRRVLELWVAAPTATYSERAEFAGVPRNTWQQREKRTRDAIRDGMWFAIGCGVYESVVING